MQKNQKSKKKHHVGPLQKKGTKVQTKFIHTEWKLWIFVSKCRICLVRWVLFYHYWLASILISLSVHCFLSSVLRSSFCFYVYNFLFVFPDQINKNTWFHFRSCQLADESKLFCSCIFHATLVWYLIWNLLETVCQSVKKKWERLNSLWFITTLISPFFLSINRLYSIDILVMDI